MTTKPKYKLNEAVWAVDTYGGRGGVMQGEVSGIQITEKGHVEYMMSSDQHRCHSRAECDVFLTQEEAWAQRQKLKDERAKAQAARMANGQADRPAGRNSKTV